MSCFVTSSNEIQHAERLFFFFFFYECNAINKYVYLKKREGGGGERKKCKSHLQSNDYLTRIITM